MEDVGKNFGRIKALSDITFDIKDNEILALVGDNGAGKSTLVKILTGIHQPDEGNIHFDGESIKISSPDSAREHGIGVVYQDLGLVDTLSVAENVFLGNYLTKEIAGISYQVDWSKMNTIASETISERLGLDLNPTTQIELLSGGERQAVAIARALVVDPKVVILDEPTAELSEKVSRKVHKLIHSMKEQGHTIVLVDHNIENVVNIADRIIVLHNGNHVATVDASKVDKDEVIQMMISGEAVEVAST